jgi:hypothetical protein
MVTLKNIHRRTGLLEGIGIFQVDFPRQQFTCLDTTQFAVPAEW